MWDIEKVQDASRLQNVLRHGLLKDGFALQELEEGAPVVRC